MKKDTSPIPSDHENSGPQNGLQWPDESSGDLQKQLSFYKIMYEQSRDGIVILRTDGRVYDANRRFAEMLGYALDEVRTLHVWDWDVAYSRDDLLQMLGNFRKGPAGYFEARHRRRDGVVLDVEISSHGTAVDGLPLVFCTCRDVSERKKTEQTLEKERSFFRNLIRTLPDMVWLNDSDGRFLFCNPPFEGFFGFKEEEILGKTNHDFLPRDLADLIREKDLAVIAAGRTVVGEEELRFAGDGHYEIVEISKTPVYASNGELTGVLGIARNITAFRETERALRESRANLIESQRMARIGNFVFDLRAGTWVSSEILDDILGITADHPHTLDQWLEQVHPDDRPDIEAYFWYQAINRQVPFDREYRIVRCDDQSIRWVHGMGRPELDDTGKVQFLRGSIQEITEWKKTALELQNLAEAVDQATEGIFITGVDGRIGYVNPAISKISGYGVEEAIGQNIRTFFNGKIDHTFSKEIISIVLRGKRWAGRVFFPRKDGAFITAEVSISPLKNKQGRVVNFVGIIRDISMEIKIEERLSQAQKMEAIGTLAGGIAHDFNNILSPLIGYAELLKLDIATDSPLQAYVSQILNAAGRAKNLVMQILTFSRQSDRELKPIKLQPIIREALKLLRSSIPSTIEMVHEVDETCGPVIADATEIHQIIMNLATNAYQSMEDKGGRLTVMLEQLKLNGAAADQLGLAPGPYARLNILDTGIGIRKEILEKIFDPYFTTKEKEKGTGLGLSVVQGIVKSCKGHVQVDSEPDAGTNFHVYLPIIALDYDSKEIGEAPVMVGGTEKILVVDDEEMIALVTQRLLERLGYKVTIRVSSLEALAAFKAAPDRFDLVITDMTMPQMTGDILVRELKKIRPGIPIIMCTGFSERIKAEDLKAIGIASFLMKPLNSAVLSLTVREILDQTLSG